VLAVHFLVPVVDPDIPLKARHRLDKGRKKARRGADPESRSDVHGRGCALLGVLAALGIVVAGAASGALAVMAWLWGIAFAVLSIHRAVIFRSSAARAAYTGLYRRYMIDEERLDDGASALLLRVQQAIAKILRSEIYRSGMLDGSINEPVLRHHEWRIAVTLRDLTAVRRAAEGLGRPSSPGSMAARVVNAQMRARDLVRRRVADDVQAIEHLATAVLAADDAYSDHQQAAELAAFNAVHRDLLARAMAGETAAAEIAELADTAGAAAEAMHLTLAQASHAAEVLAIPSPGEGK